MDTVIFKFLIEYCGLQCQMPFDVSGDSTTIKVIIFSNNLGAIQKRRHHKNVKF